MRLPRGVRRLFRLGTARPDVVRDVDDEIGFHFERLVQELRAGGMDEEEALGAARERFGDVRAYRYALTRIDGGRVAMRERIAWLDVTARSLGLALRGIRRSPGLALGVSLILALGIGANATMFGVVDRLLLSPPQHIADADQVRHVYLRRESYDGTRPAGRTLTFPDYQDLLQVDAFASVAAHTSGDRRTMGHGTVAEQVRVVMASASLFPLLGVDPQRGRFFTPDDDALDANPVAVLAHEFWQRRFGADPGVLGSTLDIGGGAYEVVGVAPPGFTGAELEPVDIWLPIVRAQQIEADGTAWMDGEYNRNQWWLRTVIRLRPGVTDEVATAEATAAHRAGRATLIAEDRYDSDAELITASVIAARGPDPSAEARVTTWLAGVSLIVLLIACFNVANLLLARAARLRRELAVRTALGISRVRLLAEQLTESLLLAALGAVGAVALARFGGAALHDVLLPNVAFTDDTAGTRLLVFLAACTVLTAALAGFLPALQASRTDVSDALRAGGRGSPGRGSRVRLSLLVGQAALSSVLLVGAGLFVLSLRRAETTDMGIDPEQVIVVRPQWVGTPPGEERLQLFVQAEARMRRLPEVLSTARTFSIPFWSSYGIGRPRVPGLDSVPRHPTGGPYANKVGAGYFETMGLAILRGRPIEGSDDDADARPVAVVSESMAGAYWPAGDALGQCMIFGDDADEPLCTTVVGVVENFRRQELVEDDPHFQYFLNQAHPAFQGPPQALMVRVSGRASERVESLRREFRSVSPLVRFAEVRPLMSNIEPQLRSWRLGAAMFTVFGALALVVAGWGLYSVLAFDVALRHHELGVRAALGAGAPRLVGLVLRQAAALVSAGVVLGLVLALTAARLVQPLLYRVSATEPVVYAGVALTLLVVAALAGTLPALRTTRVEPAEALRAE